MTDISIDYLRECFDLDQTAPSGLRWRERPQSHFPNRREQREWNQLHALRPAGGPSGGGFAVKLTTPDGHQRRLSADRVCFAVRFGRWPGEH